jgi:Icc-related predicted phosphoesterase
VKILHASDLHLQQEWFDWVVSHSVEYDLLVIAGDLQNAFSNTPLHTQSRLCSEWLLSLQTPTVVCSGNHDFWVSDRRVSVDVQAEAGWLRNLRGRGHIIAVDGDTVDFHGLKIAVNGWLQVPDLHDRVDIVVTHAPPMGCACASGAEAEGRDNGDPELFPAVQYNPPTLILAGHIHAPQKYACTWPPIDPTTLILVPGCDEEAEIPNHWVIDTAERTARHSSGELVHWKS